MSRKKIYTQEELNEKRRAYQRDYTKRKHVRERINKTLKIFRDKNKEQVKLKKSILRKKLRKQDPIHFVCEATKYSARKRGLIAPYTNTEYRVWFKSQDPVCVYCGSDVKMINNYLHKIKLKKTFRRLAIDRKDASKGYLFNNMVLACYVCNTAKQAIFSHEDFKEIAKKYILPKFKII
jgi:5-methylcytosine-specific restriction endonuclease McrA